MNTNEWFANNNDKLTAFLDTLPQPDWTQVRSFLNLCAVSDSNDISKLLEAASKMDDLTLCYVWSKLENYVPLLLALHQPLAEQVVQAANTGSSVHARRLVWRSELYNYAVSLLPSGAVGISEAVDAAISAFEKSKLHGE